MNDTRTQGANLVWFRNDLRLADHVALTKALSAGGPVIPCYIHDAETSERRDLGGASRWWLHQSLLALIAAIESKGSRLILRSGPVVETLCSLVEETGASGVYFTRRYDPDGSAEEQALKEELGGGHVQLRRCAGSLLVEPENIRTKTGGIYKVYTPFWRALSQLDTRQPVPEPDTLPAVDTGIASDDLAEWNLTPARPDWAKGWEQIWQPGEKGARKRLDEFLADGVARYEETRNRPDLDLTSRLSPHLRFGELSPNTVWYAVLASAGGNANPGDDRETFLKEVVWREFSYHLLFNFPELPDQPFKPEFANFPWRRDEAGLRAWQKGQTGYPIVDAGMRQLWQTGWMHNRVRMIVASFLVKHQLIPWQDGEAWFWDTLVDADPASNAASWQWVAGSGADAAPYFRIFNPISQGEKFDPRGDYVRRYVPEIADLPDKYLFSPWTAPAEVLAKAGIELGKTYPKPIVDHASARKRALAGYETIKTR